MAGLGGGIRLQSEGQVVDFVKLTIQRADWSSGIGCRIRLHFEIYLALGLLMEFVATSMETAAADTDVLRSLDRNGDHFSMSRDVDFLLVAPDAEKAALVASFINDHSYGKAILQDPASVLVTINMPVEQPVALCVSGFFTCLARLFGVEYDGWGCVAQPQT